jgi:hypothetical protein
MKKSLLIAAFAGLAMVACKKDYTCECTTSSNVPGFVTTTNSGSTGKMKKADAESKCNEGDKTYSTASAGVTYTSSVECTLK